MPGNTFGNFFKVTTFGESHGKAIGGIIDGCPSNVKININEIQYNLNRRKPGQSNIVSQRNESDKIEILSGIFKNKTTGAPIGFIIYNYDHHSSDYSNLKNSYRPSHADFTYDKKYKNRDYRGGGRTSARETACRVVAGFLAKQILKNIKITAYVSSIGNISIKNKYNKIYLNIIEKTPIRCPNYEISNKMIELINKIKKNGNTIGGIISCIINNVPIGLGDPVFNKLNADLGKAMLSINAVKGFEYGSGFDGTKMTGEEHNDEFNKNYSTKTNFSGGIQGGISNGMEIYFRVAFKPISTIMKKQNTIDVKGNKINLIVKGRHDPCVVPRAVPIVESMAYLVILDHFICNNIYKQF